MADAAPNENSSRREQAREEDEEVDDFRHPSKKVFMGTKLVDLNLIFVSTGYGNSGSVTPLSTFLPAERVASATQLPQFYDYDKLRAWLLKKGGIPVDEAIKVTLLHLNGRLHVFLVEDAADLGTPLCLLQYGAFTPMHHPTLGAHIHVRKARARAAPDDDRRQDPAAAEGSK